MKPKGYGSDVKKCGYEMGVKPRSGGPEKVKPKGDGPRHFLLNNFLIRGPSKKRAFLALAAGFNEITENAAG